MELGAADSPASTGRLMAAVTHVLTLDYVARILDEDVELLKAIISNDDNLTYGNIISVCIGPDEAITALTDHGVDELTDMLSEARLTAQSWHQFLDDFVDDTDLAARFKAQPSR
ncbi:hypothetical protein [Sphingobium sp. DC-2]|uniref:hypothetical protein n=1 Tax=Sphingobium sp. DC-2 TaxID=1303256 RepID=UPI001ED9C355|nr:hypothetical protein [Sphingobium sp. DC-2]